MPVKLHYSLLSPPSRSVMVVLKILNVPHELRSVELLKAEHRTPEYSKMNPQRSVPVLDDNGFLVLDSHAINAYLVSMYAKDDKLYPKDLKARSVVDHRLHFDSGVLFQTYRNVIREFRSRTRTGLTEEIVKQYEYVYKVVEDFLRNHKFIAADEVTIADISVVTSLTAMAILWSPKPKKFPLITSYMKICQTDIPHLARINETGIEATKAVLEGFNYNLEKSGTY